MSEKLQTSVSFSGLLDELLTKHIPAKVVVVSGTASDQWPGIRALALAGPHEFHVVGGAAKLADTSRVVQSMLLWTPDRLDEGQSSSGIEQQGNGATMCGFNANYDFTRAQGTDKA